MDLKKQYGTDKALEENGVWQDIGDGASVLVARMGNSRNVLELKRLTAPHKRQIQLGKLDDEIWKKINIEAIADSILLDWKGVEINGKELPYSKPNAIQVLTDYADFRDVISTLANDMANYQNQEKEAAIKN